MMKLRYLSSAQTNKEELISNYKIEKEIHDLEKVIEDNPKVVLTDKIYNLRNIKFPLLKRTSSVFFSTNMFINGVLELYFIYIEAEDLAIIIDVKLLL